VKEMEFNMPIDGFFKKIAGCIKCKKKFDENL
jgi:hypothetical protein